MRRISVSQVSSVGWSFEQDLASLSRLRREGNDLLLPDAQSFAYALDGFLTLRLLQLIHLGEHDQRRYAQL